MNERNNGRPGYKFNIKGAWHLVFGLLFVGFAISILATHQFVGRALDATSAYAVGGLLILYGAFRIWRGIQDMKSIGND